MIKTVSRMMAATAALGLVAAPIVAQANTRAGASGSVYGTSNAGPGLGRASGGEGQGEEEAGIGGLFGGSGSGFLLLPAFGLITLGGLTAGGVLNNDDDDAQSPGT